MRHHNGRQMWSRCAVDGRPGEDLGMTRAVNLRMGIPGVGGEKGLSKKQNKKCVIASSREM